MKSASRESPGAGLRCATYVRVSTDDRLSMDFNSLDAQRESCELFIRSQGWECLPQVYSDGGYSGGTLDRPGLKQLLADVAAGKIDVVVVYKVDRMSRSLLDFARLIELFEKYGVSFVCVTQQFNTHTSMGRLVLNVLLSFAEFERAVISERTRDKIAATRRRGKWTGGAPLLGYDVAPGPKLVVNEAEAGQVRAIFGLYLELGSLLATAEELNRRGWVTKRWTTRGGRPRGGQPFCKTSMHKILTNVLYAGSVRYRTEIHQGEHSALIDADVFQRVQKLLQQHGRSGGAEVRNKFGALLRGLLRCSSCNCSMSPAHSTKGSKRYRYYLCQTAAKRGWRHCPSKSVPAHEIERFVVEQIKRIGRDPMLAAEVAAEAGKQVQERLAELSRERRGCQRELTQAHGELRELLKQFTPGNDRSTALLADLQERIRLGEQRFGQLHDQETALQRQLVDPEQVVQTLGQFDALWDSLLPREQVRVVQLLVERVDYDGSTGAVSIHFHDLGIQSLAEELSLEQVA